MDAQELHYIVVAIGIAVCGAVVCCTKWLADAERIYPRDQFPRSHNDQFRGAYLGFAVGIAWSGCDIVLSQLKQRELWDLAAWELRCAVFISLLLAGCLTFGELFRVMRCTKISRNHSSESS